jgi:hypothetical protein
MNPSVTFGICFVDDFLVDTDSVSLTFSESTEDASADESTRDLWKPFR